MDAEDLDYRARTFTGCIPPATVTRLVALGHLDEVRSWAGRGEWFCAREWAWQLAAEDRPAEALEVLAPYVATGWWVAAATTADLLESWGRIDEAIATTRPHADGGNRLALDHVARLLARHGRGDEAFALLEPHIEDWFLATALVAVAAGAGRDEDAAVLLTAHVETSQPRCVTSGSFAIDLLAEIRERQGRADEAVALLRTRSVTSINNRDQLADLLARHDRIEELREYATADHHGHAARRLADLLEERGDVAGAIAAHRRSPNRQSRAVYLAELLDRHGRADEALETLLSLADAAGADDWLVHMICERYAAQGRPEQGLAYLDTLRARWGHEDWEYFSIRLPLLVATGRRADAIALARAHPEGGSWYAAEAVAGLLIGDGRTEEATAVLAQHGTRGTRAAHLIELGRIEEAVTLLQQQDPQSATADPWATV